MIGNNIPRWNLLEKLPQSQMRYQQALQNIWDVWIRWKHVQQQTQVQKKQKSGVGWWINDSKGSLMFCGWNMEEWINLINYASSGLSLAAQYCTHVDSARGSTPHSGLLPAPLTTLVSIQLLVPCLCRSVWCYGDWKYHAMDGSRFNTYRTDLPGPWTGWHVGSS